MALAVRLVHEGVLTGEQLVEKICLNPARIAQIGDFYQDKGGAVLVNPNLSWQVTEDTMQSAGKNTPFIGQTLMGKVEQVLF